MLTKYSFVLTLLSSLPLLSQPYAISTVAGTNRVLDGQNATTAPLRTPVAVAVDSAGNLYVADEDDNRVRKVAASTNIITTLAGTGLPDTLATVGRRPRPR